MNDREYPSIPYLRTAAHNRLVGRLKDAAQLREAVVLHLEYYVRPRRAVVVEIIIVTHQLLRTADVRAKYRVGLHAHSETDTTGTTRASSRKIRGECSNMYINVFRCQILATSASRVAKKQLRVVLIVVKKKK